MTFNKVFVILSLCFLFISCQKQDNITLSGLNSNDFIANIDGKEIALYTLENNNGLEACITNYGGRLVSLMIPDKNGKFEDVVCGFPTINGYLENKQNFGATIGRYIGRILNATFSIDSITYNLTPNTGVHCAHGGNNGFANRVWNAKQINNNTLELTLLSEDGDNGFPGNLLTTLTYTLTDNNELDIDYKATTDKPTVINLSHHSFFNISGNLSRSVEDQILYINSNEYTPYDSLKCVTGEIIDVTNTPFDFRLSQPIGSKINDENFQLSITNGYDHNWVLNTNGDINNLAAKVVDIESGRVMEVYTNEPGIQVYTSNGLKGNLVGKNNIPYHARTSICLETQHYPDSPNKPQFPSTVLRPNEIYNSRCIYKFDIEK